MKIKLLAGALLIGSGVAFAQTNRAINYTPTTSVQSSINKLFSQLNTTGINSGILMDKSPNFVSADLYDGSTNSATATTNTWYQLMAQTRAAQLSGNNNFLSDTYLLDTVSGQNANNRISLGLLFINYHKIKNPATATQGWFTLSNGKLVDVPNRTENPYQQNVLVATAPLKQHNADGEVKFIIPSSLVMNNRGAFTLQADWGLGNGYQNIQLNTEYPVKTSH
jgi:hypothetical protein